MVKRVMIVDDHFRVRQSLSFALNSFKDLLLVGVAADGLEAVSVCSEAHPDVILMDVQMPHMGGIEATKVICAKYPSVRVIMLTSFEEGLTPEALESGAVALLNKNASLSELVDAIRAA